MALINNTGNLKQFQQRGAIIGPLGLGSCLQSSSPILERWRVVMRSTLQVSLQVSLIEAIRIPFTATSEATEVLPK